MFFLLLFKNKSGLSLLSKILRIFHFVENIFITICNIAEVRSFILYNHQ